MYALGPKRKARFPRASRQGWLSLCLLTAAIAVPAQTPQPASPVVLDRVVAVVNNHAILASDVDDEMRLSVLEPRGIARGPETPQDALQRLISRALIEQQMLEQEGQIVEPTDVQIAERLSTIRRELPVCVQAHCATDAGWTTFLATHSLTQQRVETYLRNRLAILHFIELRFRQGISIPRHDIQTYYQNTLLPQYPAGQPAPSLEQVAPRIEEILLQQQVNALFTDWLQNLRKQGDVEILDPSLEVASAPAKPDPGTQ